MCAFLLCCFVVACVLAFVVRCESHHIIVYCVRGNSLLSLSKSLFILLISLTLLLSVQLTLQEVLKHSDLFAGSSMTDSSFKLLHTHTKMVHISVGTGGGGAEGS